MNDKSTSPLKLQVAEALSKDVGRTYARMGPEDMQRLGLEVGDIVTVAGKRQTVAKVMLCYKAMREQSCIQLDGISRHNAGVGLGDRVEVSRADACPAQQLTLTPVNQAPTDKDLNYIGSLVDGLVVTQGDLMRVSLFGRRAIDFRVKSTTPKTAVVIGHNTELIISEQREESSATTISYEDVGGIKSQLQRIREMIELPLRFPELFEQLGIDAPKGVLLYGPPGCGKTLIARIIAHETDANFFSVSGAEVIHKFYGESEAHLRKIFDEAGRKGPSIIFLDEIDAIAPRRDQVTGEVEKRVVAQLLALMDGLNRRQNVIVIAATNLPNALDPALRRPGRFDREISIPIPDRDGRLQILEIHSRGMPLAEDVKLNRLADMTHGFVGADLEALCREAAMSSLRELLPNINLSLSSIPYEQLASLQVKMDDFLVALREVEPSAIREVFVEIPNVCWDDVGGLTEVKQQLIEAIEWPLNYPQLFEQSGVRPPKGLLLCGPAGVGKTLIAKAVANESGVNVISIKGPALISKFVGESEKGVREIFHKARQAAPCIVFFDEIDALIPVRSNSGSDSHVAERVLSQFLAEMDGIDDLKGVFILGATNRSDLIDPAMLRPGRFDQLIQIPLPDIQARTAILDIHLREKSLAPGVDSRNLAERTAGYSGAEVAGLCNRAALLAIRRVVDAAGGDPGCECKVLIGQEDFELVLAQMGKHPGAARPTGQD
ncbi:CDC48 family AAA ATPase [Shewanella salipaludis]|uniref:CDC48 family AAA ATPase n=1 Tax=Shewanella salipaludis TaxID=2723052 RepID=A0A972G8I6_9GAMM|nr:CDC48 family AAA ATPase [Shewanella salipaludis]NMH66465.1 CDC48 family AAA ATPase [Shewanella salipaludis]